MISHNSWFFADGFGILLAADNKFFIFGVLVVIISYSGNTINKKVLF